MKNNLIIMILTLLVAFSCEQKTKVESPVVDESAMIINIPDHLSPEMKKVFANWKPYWEMPDFEELPAPDDYEGWAEANEQKKAVAIDVGKAVIAQFGNTTEEKFLGGVRTLDIKPKNWKNKNKVILHTHGGGFYAHSPETALILSVPLADKLGIRIISVDYKLMPSPDWTVLDQRDQVIDVFNALMNEEGYAPENIGAVGCSAGGALTISFVNALSNAGSPIPGAIVVQAPMVDFTYDSDTHTTLAVDDPVVNISLWKNYTAKMLGITPEQAKSPEYSSVFDDYTGRPFPPTMIQVGTKEVMLGDAVRMYNRLAQDGVNVMIDPHDAMIHCFHAHYYCPEAKLATARTAAWFTKYLQMEE